MELAVSTLFCLHKPFEEALADITASGARRIEVVDAGSHTLSQGRVEKLREISACYGIRYSVHAPFTDVNISANDSAVREAILARLERSIVWASELEARVLVYHPGNATALERLSPGSAWKTNIESVKRLDKFARDHGIEALIENVPEPFPYVMKSVEHFARFFDEIGVESEMVLDVAHANIRGEVFDFIERFHDKIRHVHVSDNNGDSDSHLRIGEGAIDWERVMDALSGTSYDGWVTVESYRGVEESLSRLERLL